MSLDNIQLSPAVVQGLYRKSLVQLEPPQVLTDNTSETRPKFLGKNAGHVLILVDEASAVFLPEQCLDFLVGVLSACGLTMEDVAIVNRATNTGLGYSQLISHFEPVKVLLFGTTPADWSFPLEFPFFQLQKYDQKTFIYSPALSQVQADVDLKKQLWNALKNMFAR
jgi:hypothetical protein